MKNVSKIIKKLYLSLFLLTPLLFTFQNSELFEIPKMYFVYFITLLIVFLHLYNWINGSVPLYKKNFLNPFLLLFLISQIICTLTSIDIHTSFFGYYSRLNGGLLSIISYFLLYSCLIPYLDDKQKSDIINISLFSGLIVSLYGVLEHFGINKNLWVQDVQSRVFSTLGQPNWLAAYLAILLPLSIYKITSSSTKKLSTFYFLLSTFYYICLLFTKSKSGILATIISLAVFFIFIFFRKNSPKKLLIINYSLLIILSLIINNPIKDFIFPQKISSNLLKIENSKTENLNITPSSDIRKIVWKGSIDLFKKFPLFGTGVETFAYSYYWTRPLEHNLTSEWDFLYNKAHNEYLNYLATTGLVGSLPYLVLTITVLFLLIKNSFRNPTLEIRNLSIALLSSYISILITNGFGFSVVVVSLYFFLFPALSGNQLSNHPTTPHPRHKYSIPLLFVIFIILTKNIISSYIADIYLAKFESSNSRQEYQLAYQHISKSIFFRPNDPNYLINLATAAAKMAVLTKEQTYIDQAINSSTQATKISPANINYLKQQAQVYYYLATIDTNYFIKTVESMLQASKLAPTDAKIPYSLGQFLESVELLDDAVYYYQKAVDLKPNYDHAYFALGKIYFDQKKYDLAKKNLDLNLLYTPTNIQAQEMLKKIN
ncbi:MAG: O-antigen ligase family protein [Candidatus Shapirobacteria bacterium]|nr:O-antigen ligase family protein [Candidatus Shapirobacteria bacterium]